MNKPTSPLTEAEMKLIDTEVERIGILTGGELSADTIRFGVLLRTQIAVINAMAEQMGVTIPWPWDAREKSNG